MKLLNFLIVLFLLPNISANAQQSTSGQYIVSIKETSLRPVIDVLTQQGNDRVAKQQNAESTRAQKLEQLRAIRSQLGIDERNLLFEGVDAAVVFAVTLDENQANDLRKSPDVESVEGNVTVELEPMSDEPDPRELTRDGQTTPCAITNAGGKTDGSGKSTYIWILDTGIDTDHPDLNVITDPVYSKSFITGETVEDNNGHGTHVAGIAAAKDNSIGTVGVSAGAKVVAVKVLANSGTGSVISIIKGLDHVAKYFNVNDVVNMSFGAKTAFSCENGSPSYQKAVRNLGLKGVWVCIAAGNDKCDAGQSRPACFNGKGILTVGSVSCSQACSFFSNFNGSVVDWVATGASVYSTFKNGTYKTLSGTSMATPVVAGICHARGGAPLSSGTISCSNSCVPAFIYNIARR